MILNTATPCPNDVLHSEADKFRACVESCGCSYFAAGLVVDNNNNNWHLYSAFSKVLFKSA